MAVSIKDLAKLAGVSVSTVTRALADKPDVNRETKRRVLELAEEHSYRPNILARSLVTSRTYSVGVIVPDLTNPFFPALIKSIESTLWSAGYSVILADTNFDRAKERQTVDQFLSRRVDGLIMSPVETYCYQDWMEQIRAAGVAFVSLSRLANHEADTVVASDRFGGHAAAEHLLNLGRNKIVYIGNESSDWANTERIAGLREAHAEAGLQFTTSMVRNIASGSIEASRRAVSQLIDAGVEFNAVISFSDFMALGVRAALVDAGLRIPEDVALVGFDNIEISSLPEISLTTVDLPKVELGRASAQLVVERIDEYAERAEQGASGATAPYKEIVLNTQLIVRGTTGT